MLLRFTKMHGLGNDFMVLDLVSQHAQMCIRDSRKTVRCSSAAAASA